MAAIIFMCFAVPPLFGFQNFVQWGAMYDDRWCTVIQYEKSPHETPDARFETIVIASDVPRVYSAPTQNRKTCLALARMHCGRATKQGWITTWVEPSFQGQVYMGQSNVCDMNVSSLDHWFDDGQ